MTNVDSWVMYNVIQRIIAMAGPVVGCVVQLFVGTMSDRTSYKHGRRRIFILVGLGFFVVGVLLMMVFLIFPIFFANRNINAHFNLSMVCDCLNVCENLERICFCPHSKNRIRCFLCLANRN